MRAGPADNTEAQPRAPASRAGLRLFYVGPLVLWMALIFALSTHVGGSGRSRGMLANLLRWLDPAFVASLSPDQLEWLNHAARKCAHFTEYLVLGLLALRAFVYGRRVRPWMLLSALALSAVYAASDELHQVFVGGRTPSPWDVLIDSSGSAFGLALAAAWCGVKAVERRMWGREK